MILLAIYVELNPKKGTGTFLRKKEKHKKGTPKKGTGTFLRKKEPVPFYSPFL